MTVADIHTPARAQPRRSLKIGRLSLPWFFLFREPGERTLSSKPS